MVYTQADADLAAQQVQDCQERIFLSDGSIGEVRRLGFPTYLAEDALATMRQTLRHMLDHQAAIETDLAGGKPSLNSSRDTTEKT